MLEFTYAQVGCNETPPTGGWHKGLETTKMQLLTQKKWRRKDKTGKNLKNWIVENWKKVAFR